MKSILLIMLTGALTTSCFSRNRNDDYQAWFNTFITDFQKYPGTLDAENKADLATLFEMKPGGNNSGRYYGVWFNKAFCWFIDDTHDIARPSEDEKMKYILDAMPDLNNTGQFYNQYLQYVLKKIEDFMPVLDDSDKKCFEYFKKAKPKNTGKDYKIWLTEYNRIKEDYGPVYTDNENYILRFLMEIKPEGEKNQNAVYRVRGETLLRIKYLIQNNEPNTAANEIDKILES
ncbi:MAG: hypothetical protein JW925_07065 [Syntrophaceae bacterium]|nr:hypothetical protein [Syntrophaceae bacterium]